MGKNKPYLLTGGIGELIEQRHGLSFGVETHCELENIGANYAIELGGVLNGYIDDGVVWNVKYVPGKQIDNSLREMVLSSGRSNPLLSFDDVCCVDLADASYSVTRVMDPNALERGTMLGPRFGKDSLEDQTKLIKEKYGNKIDVIDIGVFEGETLVGELEKRFMPQGIQIENVYVAFAGPGARENLAKYGTALHSCWDYDWAEWLEIRDCIGLDGRKIIMETPEDHINSFIPYTGDPENWASIPPKYVDKFRALYSDTFGKIRDVLGSAGHNASLEKSQKFKNVLNLKIT